MAVTLISIPALCVCLSAAGPVWYALPLLCSQPQRAFSQLLSISISNARADSHVIPSLEPQLSEVLGDIFSLTEQSQMNPCRGSITSLTGDVRFNWCPPNEPSAVWERSMHCISRRKAAAPWQTINRNPPAVIFSRSMERFGCWLHRCKKSNQM